MRKTLVVLGVVTSSVVIGAMIPASSQEGGTITVCSQSPPDYLRHIDVAKKGFSPGDYHLLRDKLLHTQTGNGAGRVVGRLTIVKRLRKADDYRFIADITTQLQSGKITSYGSGRFRSFRQGLKFAITGGTGSNNDARGEVLAKVGKCGGERGLRLTFDLV